MDKELKPNSGALFVALITALFAFSIWLFVVTFGNLEMLISIAIFITSLTLLFGFYTLQPNESRVIILFGRYVGTVKKAGFFWGNPFYSNGSTTKSYLGQDSSGIKKFDHLDKRFKLSLRSRTFTSATLKVNDRPGNPIEIAAVIIWKIEDAAKAVFQVDEYRAYVETQTETALRHIATQFSYDHKNNDQLTSELTLRGNPEEVAAELRKDLEGRLAIAGVVIVDARLSHLAYAPEIAQAMLRRQQAEAVIAARSKIVEGAVTMVQMAVTELEKSSMFKLDDERKAAMVSNLMIILCGDKEATPIINTGTLYN
jgi:regulator of protease activity HflC (stomatin/prohibitin superfamily)